MRRSILFLALAFLAVPVGVCAPTPIPEVPATVPETLTNSWFATGPDGVLVGGMWNIHSDQRRALYWDFATETWTEIPTLEATSFSRGIWSDVAGGFILLTTYSEHTDARLIQPPVGEISEGWPRSIARGHQGAALPGDFLPVEYFLGGFETPSVPVVYCDRFNLITLTWENLPDLPEGRIFGNALLDSDGILWFSGGRDSSGLTVGTTWFLEGVEWQSFSRDTFLPRERGRMWKTESGEILISGGVMIYEDRLPTPLPQVVLGTTESISQGNLLEAVFNEPRQEFEVSVDLEAGIAYGGSTGDGPCTTVEEIPLPLDKGRWVPSRGMSPLEIEKAARNGRSTWTVTHTWREPVFNAGTGTLPDGRQGMVGGTTAGGEDSSEFKKYPPDAPTDVPTTSPFGVVLILITFSSLLALAGFRRR